MFKGNRLYFILPGLLFFFFTISQTTASALTIEDARTPTSPAFKLLDIAPSLIEKPQTPRQLGLNLLTAYDGNDIGIDFAPYWFFPHNELEFKQYYNPDFVQSIQQNLSVSLISANVSASQTTRALGVGIKTILVQGRPSKKLEGIKKDILVEQDKILDGEGDPDRLKELNLNFQEESKHREGFIVEVGCAIANNYPQNNWSNSQPLKNGFWLTPSFTRENIDFIGVFRRISDKALNQNYSDYGAKFCYHINNLFAASGEYLSRSISNAGNTQRYALILEYQLDKDRIITGSIGKDFDNTSFNPSNNPNMIAFLGLNWGFGDKPSIEIKN